MLSRSLAALLLSLAPVAARAQRLGHASLKLGDERQVVVKQLSPYVFDLQGDGYAWVKDTTAGRNDILGLISFDHGRLHSVSRDVDVSQASSYDLVRDISTLLRVLGKEGPCTITSNRAEQADLLADFTHIWCGNHTIDFEVIEKNAQAAGPAGHTWKVSEAWSLPSVKR